MASQPINGPLILLLLLVALMTSLWKVIVVALLVAGVGLLSVGVVVSLGMSRLRTVTKAANTRFAGDVCRFNHRYAILEAIEIEPNTAQPVLAVRTLAIASVKGVLTQQQEIQRLPVPPALSSIGTPVAFGRYLQRHGIVPITDLAVEAKATRAALGCLREVTWAGQALNTMQTMVHAAEDTLTKAQGNELLEPSIPQLQDALRALETERQKLQRHRQDSLAMLRKLHDFLSVPETIRPILSFDLDQLFDPARCQELEASFDEVVNLNNVFLGLSRDRLS